MVKHTNIVPEPARQNQDLTHQQRCDRLLSSEHLKGWERLFTKAVGVSKAISRKDAEKLAAIESKIFSTTQNN